MENWREESRRHEEERRKLNRGRLLDRTRGVEEFMPDTRSTTSLPGGVSDYLLENRTEMAPTPTEGPSTEDLIRMASSRLGIVTDENVPETQEEQESLLSDLLKSLKDLSNKIDDKHQRQILKVDTCPVKKSNMSLESWIEEVKIWMRIYRTISKQMMKRISKRM